MATEAGCTGFGGSVNQAGLGQMFGLVLVQRSCGPTDKASDYESGDCRFESCQGQLFFIYFPLELIFKLIT